MMLTVQMGSNMDHNFYALWQRDISWEQHVRLLDPNITDVVFNPGPRITTIYFSAEEFMTWFILRWS